MYIYEFCSLAPLNDQFSATNLVVELYSITKIFSITICLQEAQEVNNLRWPHGNIKVFKAVMHLINEVWLWHTCTMLVLQIVHHDRLCLLSWFNCSQTKFVAIINVMLNFEWVFHLIAFASDYLNFWAIFSCLTSSFLRVLNCSYSDFEQLNSVDVTVQKTAPYLCLFCRL